MSRKKGSPKTGGRVKGTPNVATRDFRERIYAILDNNWDKIQGDLEGLEPKDRLQFIEKLLPYVTPKQTEMELYGNTPEHFEIVHVVTGAIPAKTEDEVLCSDN